MLIIKGLFTTPFSFWDINIFVFGINDNISDFLQRVVSRRSLGRRRQLATWLADYFICCKKVELTSRAVHALNNCQFSFQKLMYWVA